MSTKPDNGGPAFPGEQHETRDGSWNQTFEAGMSLRDWFAGQALAGLNASGPHDCGPKGVAHDAYAMADAMLAERAK